jgi:hypothetical protein
VRRGLLPLHFGQQPKGDRPRRLVFFQVDQQLAEGAAVRFLAMGDFRPPEPHPPERVVIDLRLPASDDSDTD